jgi:hypothetical protein
MTFLEKKRFAESLQYNSLAQFMGWQISGAGKDLYDRGQVEIITYSDSSLECLVKEGFHKQRVTIQMQHSQILSSCDCKAFQRKYLCKHVAAAAIAVQKVLSEEIRKSWENRLLFIHNPRRQPIETPRNIPDYLLVFALFNDYYGWKIKPLTAPVEKVFGRKTPDSIEWSQGRVVEVLAQNHQVRNQFKAQFKHLRGWGLSPSRDTSSSGQDAG